MYRISVNYYCYSSFDEEHSQDEEIHLDCFCSIASAIEVSKAVTSKLLVPSVNIFNTFKRLSLIYTQVISLYFSEQC